MRLANQKTEFAPADETTFIAKRLKRGAYLLSRDYVFFSLRKGWKVCDQKTLSKVDIEPTPDFLPYSGGG